MKKRLFILCIASTLCSLEAANDQKKEKRTCHVVMRDQDGKINHDGTKTATNDLYSKSYVKKDGTRVFPNKIKVKEFRIGGFGNSDKKTEKKKK